MKLTEDDFKDYALGDPSHNVAHYMCIANYNPLEVVQQILDNQEIVERLKYGVKEMQKFVDAVESKFSSDNPPYIDMNQIIKEFQSILGEHK